MRNAFFDVKRMLCENQDMNTETTKQRRFQTLRAKLPHLQRRIVTEMSLVFGSSPHDLWSGETYHSSPYYIDWLKEIRKKNLDDLTNRELNSLMSSVTSTLGSEQTLKFLLPRFYVACFSEPDYGWTAEPLIIVSRLERANFETWPNAERKPVLEAMVLSAQYEIDFWSSCDYAPADDTEALQWAQVRLKEIS